ncbi:polymorphic toxin-type HINT domain-containing protein [Undibacterium sp. Ji50W]|uniref:polymorphic toxin-type HINT domain-containing protein n=1 Tax=Undibacterium sp. Ji50W TaxID=3413041 RepID=UPI003BF3341F
MGNALALADALKHSDSDSNDLNWGMTAAEQGYPDLPDGTMLFASGFDNVNRDSKGSTNLTVTIGGDPDSASVHDRLPGEPGGYFNEAAIPDGAKDIKAITIVMKDGSSVGGWSYNFNGATTNTRITYGDANSTSATASLGGDLAIKGLTGDISTFDGVTSGDVLKVLNDIKIGVDSGFSVKDTLTDIKDFVVGPDYSKMSNDELLKLGSGNFAANKELVDRAAAAGKLPYTMGGVIGDVMEKSITGAVSAMVGGPVANAATKVAEVLGVTQGAVSVVVGAAVGAAVDVAQQTQDLIVNSVTNGQFGRSNFSGTEVAVAASLGAVISKVVEVVVGKINGSTQTVKDSGGCFVKGTLVHTQNGLVPIENIRVGDWVLSQPEETGELAYRFVANTFVYQDKDIYRVSYVNEQGILESIFATPNHPFWVKDVGWVRADHLHINQVLELKDRSNVTVTAVEETDSKQEVFNFEVDGFHTYYVGELGVWVHNVQDCPGKTPEVGTPATSDTKFVPKDPVKVSNSHSVDTITPRTFFGGGNKNTPKTVARGGVDIEGDIQAINNGEGILQPDGKILTPSGRIYGTHPDSSTIYPVDGPGLVNLSQAEFAIYKEMLKSGGLQGDALRAFEGMMKAGNGGLNEESAQKLIDLFNSKG